MFLIAYALNKFSLYGNRNFITSTMILILGKIFWSRSLEALRHFRSYFSASEGLFSKMYNDALSSADKETRISWFLPI